jgi:hypothetical protein
VNLCTGRARNCIFEKYLAGKILHPAGCLLQNTSQKYTKIKAFPMKYALILAACAALICCALFAGCTSPSQAVVTPAETTVVPATPEVTAALPAPTATLDLVTPLPPEQYVDLQLTKDRTNGEIHLLYNGGKGEIYVQKIRMKTTLSDGTIIDKYMDDGQKPKRGDELVIEGTRGSDRCEVYVLTAGKTYKVIDQPIMSMRY